MLCSGKSLHIIGKTDDVVIIVETELSLIVYFAEIH